MQYYQDISDSLIQIIILYNNIIHNINKFGFGLYITSTQGEWVRKPTHLLITEALRKSCSLLDSKAVASKTVLVNC